MEKLSACYLMLRNVPFSCSPPKEFSTLWADCIQFRRHGGETKHDNWLLVHTMRGQCTAFWNICTLGYLSSKKHVNVKICMESPESVEGSTLLLYAFIWFPGTVILIIVTILWVNYVNCQQGFQEQKKLKPPQQISLSAHQRGFPLTRGNSSTWLLELLLLTDRITGATRCIFSC